MLQDIDDVHWGLCVENADARDKRWIMDSGATCYIANVVFPRNVSDAFDTKGLGTRLVLIERVLKLYETELLEPYRNSETTGLSWKR